MLVTIDISRKGNLECKQWLVMTPLSSREAQLCLVMLRCISWWLCAALSLLLHGTGRPWMHGAHEGQLWRGWAPFPELMEIVGTRGEAVSSYLEESVVVQRGKGSAIFSCWVQGQILHTRFTEQFSEQQGAGREIKQLFLILWNLLLSSVFLLWRCFFFFVKPLPYSSCGACRKWKND